MAVGRRWLYLFVGLVVCGLAFVGWAEFYTDWLWYRCDAYPVVFWRRLGTQAALLVVAAPLLYALLALNLRHAARDTAVTVALDEEQEELHRWLDSMVSPAVRWLPLLVALVGGLAATQGWQTWLMAVLGEPFGVKDPRYGLDVGFYVYRLSALQSLLALFNTLLLALAAVTALTYAGRRHIRFGGGEVTFSRRARGHLLVLGATLMLVRAGLLWLRRYQLLVSGVGLFPGAGWADVHVRQPALVLNALLAVAAALTCLWVWRPGRLAKTAYWAIGIHLAVHAVGAGIVPSVAQRLLVRPNEIERETPYMRNAVDFTRRAFGLDRVKVEDAKASGSPSREELAAQSGTLSNVRVWDHRPLLRTFKQLQEIRQYYDIVDVDSDRYTIDGRARQVLVSTREMNQAQLDDKARSWLNQHLEYTHGYGLVAALAGGSRGDGQPELVSRDLPPRGAPALALSEPRIYFGEVILMPAENNEDPRAMLPGAQTPPEAQADEKAERWRRRLNDSTEPDSSDYLLVGTSRDEFDYPETVDGREVQRRTKYTGKAGVPLGGFMRRLLFGVRLHSPELVLTSFAGPQTKVLLHRQITRRCKKVAPFLVWDTSPYPVVVNGRVQWICEGYTMSQSYPYSQIHYEQVATPRGWRWTPTWNYLRNPVKAVVDAYDGTVKLYVVDTEDPLCRTYQRLYPGMLRPASEAPAAVREHFRYPQMLFRTQIDMFGRYHMTEPGQFYASEDLWAPAREFDRELAAQRPQKQLRSTPDLYQPMAPYYIMMGLPGETREQFMLLSAYTPFSQRDKNPRDNMIAYMVGLCDGARYGELRVYRMPKDRTVYGPLQVEALIDQDETISQLLTLWDKGGSRVIRGHLLTVPVANTLLYVQPLYLEAEQKGLPELKRVVVVHEQRVVLANSFAEALDELFGSGLLAKPELRTAPVGQPAQPAPTGTVSNAVVGAAQREYDAWDEAVRAGDWASAQRHRDELGRLLKQMGAGH